VPPAGLPWHREVLGDLVRDERWLLAGRFPILNWAWRIGPPSDNPLPGPRPGTPTAPATGRLDAIMDLKADQQTTLSGEYTDEVGNPVAAPADAAVTYTVDDATVLNLVDNGDGTAVAAATGTLGQATVHAEAAFGGRTATGDLLVVVVPGDAERFTIAASDPAEVTPDV
jgi:hypothetical protein